MNNLHDVVSEMPIASPSFWFWMKAGAGLALGAYLIIIVTWIGLTVAGLSIFGALGSLLLHSSLGGR